MRLKHDERRNFQRTKKSKEKNRIYVIQEHDASRLHYDLRLEMDGVLKSWAIPKVPPTKKGIKRLAIETEDHSLEYANFEGEIPEGLYGAGTVKIWDNGTYELEERDEDKIIVRINGRKLKGRYCLIKFKGREKNWLFFKC
jgi:DNA ligase D-like protein (predicted 3'-phosphoesterase)